MPAVKAYLEHAESTRRIVGENYTHIIEAERRLVLTVQENVLVQLKNLKTHTSVAAAVGRGELKLHGWVYKFETGEVFNFRPDEGQFLPIKDMVLAETESDRTLPPI
eukprot:Opistho-1_new@86708